MLRVGLTGGLGAGKSTVARMFAARGTVVLSSDAIGRELMEPGGAVYTAIVARFGEAVVLPGGGLDRAALARLAFEQGRVEDLNAIVHPAVIAAQEQRISGLAAGAVVMIESALIFETNYGGPDGWKERFDRIVLVTAPEPMKIARFLERAGATVETRDALEAEARRRLAVQKPDEAKFPFCDYVLRNHGDVAGLEVQVERVWQDLARAATAGS
jgi:dephospho-CoA kinase